MDFDFRAKLADQSVQSLALRGADVSRRDHSQRDPTFLELLEFGSNHADSVPFDERTEQVYPVGCRQLGSEFGAE